MNLPVRYEIEHVSRYRYELPVRHCMMSVCLRPQDDDRQHLLRFDLSTDPPAPHNAEPDPFGNTKHVLNIHREHESLVITAHSIVVMLPFDAAPQSLGSDGWDALRADGDAFGDWDFLNPTALTQPSAALEDFVRAKGLDAPDAPGMPGGDPLSALHALMAAIHGSFTYEAGNTTVASPIDQALATGKGVCQDYAHVMLAVARRWGVPSRYVSGYVHTGRGNDRTEASHAWVECRLPGLGWVGLDPTNNCAADERHIRVAAGRDYRDVAPTRGVLQGGGATELDVEVRVRVLP